MRPPIAGQMPFTSPGDFNTPNEADFAHAGWVINKAAESGIVVFLAPFYLGYGCGSQGWWCSQVKGSSPATLRSYGRYVGSRYMGFSNITWSIGGDGDPAANGVAKVQEFVSGIQEFDNTHLFTAYSCPEQVACLYSLALLGRSGGTYGLKVGGRDHHFPARTDGNIN